MQEQEKIKVVIADDQTMIRQGFGYVIGLQPDLSLIGEASDGQETLEMTLRLKPDVLLLDIQMPRMTGIEALKEIIKELPDIKAVILTTFDDADYIYEGIRAGAVGFLLKDAEMEELLRAIRSAYRGEAVFRTALAAEALQRIAASGEAAESNSTDKAMESNSTGKTAMQELAEPLTARELEILQLMAYGKPNNQIARELYITEGTVKSHVHRILQKLGCEDRTQAVVAALRGGLVD